MKKLYPCLLLVLWGPAQLYAQVSDQTRATLDNIFEPIDKSQVPAHIAGEEGRKDVRVLEAIYRAAYTGRKITLA